VDDIELFLARDFTGEGGVALDLGEHVAGVVIAGALAGGHGFAGGRGGLGGCFSFNLGTLRRCGAAGVVSGLG